MKVKNRISLKCFKHFILTFLITLGPPSAFLFNRSHPADIALLKPTLACGPSFCQHKMINNNDIIEVILRVSWEEDSALHNDEMIVFRTFICPHMPNFL